MVMRRGLLVHITNLPARTTRTALLNTLAALLPKDQLPAIELTGQARAQNTHESSLQSTHESGYSAQFRTEGGCSAAESGSGFSAGSVSLVATLRFKELSHVQKLLEEACQSAGAQGVIDTIATDTCPSPIDFEVKLEAEQSAFSFSFDDEPIKYETVTAQLVPVTGRMEEQYWETRDEIAIERKERKAKRSQYNQKKKNMQQMQEEILTETVQTSSSSPSSASSPTPMSAPPPLQPPSLQPPPLSAAHRKFMRKSRASLDDVLHLSRGEGTRKKVGSREVPHRINAEEVCKH